MSDIIINGTNGAILQPDEFSGEPYRGLTQTRRWRGPKGMIQPLMAQLAAAGISFRCVSQTGAVWEIVATASFTIGGASADEVPTDIWECESTTITTQAINSPAFSALVQADIDKIQAGLTSGTAPTPALTGDALIAYNLMVKQIPYVTSSPTLRHTQITSNTFTAQVAYANVGKIFATASLDAPSLFRVGLPASGGGASGMPGGSNFGWFKHPPHVQTAAYNKVQVVQHFEFGEWSTKLHGGLI